MTIIEPLAKELVLVELRKASAAAVRFNLHWLSLELPPNHTALGIMQSARLLLMKHLLLVELHEALLLLANGSSLD